MNTNQDSCHSGAISMSGPSVGIGDAVEYGRGQIARLSFLSGSSARDIHILRLRNIFDRAGIGTSLRYVLNVLSLMREVQELKGGYWIPTPPRLVPLGKSAIILSPSPTNELGRHFQGIERAGYARVISQINGVDLPKQALEDWVGWGDVNGRTWAAGVVSSALDGMSPTVHPQSLEYFGVQRRNRSTQRWSTDARSAITLHDKVVFCRSRLAENYYRYFFGTLTNGKLVMESTPLRDVDRLQYGIAALLDQPITVEFGTDGEVELLRLFSPLPRPERRLLLGLGVRRSSKMGKTYQFQSKEHARCVVGMLQKLGCEIQKANVQ